MGDTIKQLLPATGYYAVVASQPDLGQIKLDQIPLFAWAVVNHALGSCESADSIEGVCLLANMLLVCGDNYQFQTTLQEVNGQVFVCYAPEGQLEQRPEYYRQQADQMLKVMEHRNTIAPGKIRELQDRADFAALDADKGSISH
jgi:hypothetical protein